MIRHGSKLPISSVGWVLDYVSDGSAFDPWLRQLDSFWQKCFLQLFQEEIWQIACKEWVNTSHDSLESGQNNWKLLDNWNPVEVAVHLRETDKSVW